MRHAKVILVTAIAVVGVACSSPPAAPAPTTDPGALQQTFDGLGAGPLDSSGRLTPDGRRVQDVLALQGALLRFHAARGSYPGGLADLAPSVLADVPRDPVTGDGYAYAVTAGGVDYSLSATLSNGRLFAGVPHDGR